MIICLFIHIISVSLLSSLSFLCLVLTHTYRIGNILSSIMCIGDSVLVACVVFVLYFGFDRMRVCVWCNSVSSTSSSDRNIGYRVQIYKHYYIILLYHYAQAVYYCMHIYTLVLMALKKTHLTGERTHGGAHTLPSLCLQR